MSNRSAKFVSALVATILAGANFSAVAENAPVRSSETKGSETKTAETKTAETKTAADSCLSGPKGTAPAGSHWRYRVERGTKRQCWYLGDEKKTAKAAPVQQPDAAAAPDAASATADAAPAQPAPVQAPPAQAAAPMRPAVANARAELQAPQANAAPAAAQASPAAPDSAASTNAPPSAVSARWFDAQSMGGSNGPRLAAAQPTAPTPAEAAPAPQPAAAPAPAPASVATERPSSSTQMLLIVMVGALALAALVGALVFKLTRTRTPPYQIRDEWRAPWDSIHSERTPTLMPREAVRMRLSETPPRRAEPPITRQKAVTREAEPDSAEATQQIAAMLQRLARSAAT